jgi:hypothetical protein
LQLRQSLTLSGQVTVRDSLEKLSADELRYRSMRGLCGS